MRRRAVIAFAVALMIAAGAAAVAYNRSLSFVRGAEECPWDLWIAALKGFIGPVEYVGSDGEFSYFRAGTSLYSRYKARTSELCLPETFAFGEGRPYRVGHEMIRCPGRAAP